MSKFSALGLNATLQSNLKHLNYLAPTEIQQKCISTVLSGNDVYAIAPTGTGKTAAYVLPILQKLSLTDHTKDQVRPIRALFLVPTRELAHQLEESISHYGKDLKLRTITISGGVRIESQKKKFKRGTDILIATPKRLVDLLKLKVFSLEEVKHFVMDEADRLVSMGITSDLNKILKAMPKSKQIILFSATDLKSLNIFAKENQSNQKFLSAERNQPALDKIAHTMYRCKRDDKRKNLFKLLDMIDCERALIFTRTKIDVNLLTEKLNEQGFVSEGIHNEIPLKKRQQSLRDFKDKKFSFLVATDLASRGLDIADLFYVINYDLPVNSNDYIHRVGRTARKGISDQTIAAEADKKINPRKLNENPHGKKNIHRGIQGHAFSLVSPQQERLVEKIVKAVGKDIRVKRFPVNK